MLEHCHEFFAEVFSSFGKSFDILIEFVVLEDRGGGASCQLLNNSFFFLHSMSIERISCDFLEAEVVFQNDTHAAGADRILHL